jgi:hypothetical protein
LPGETSSPAKSDKRGNAPEKENAANGFPFPFIMCNSSQQSVARTVFQNQMASLRVFVSAQVD